MLSVVSVIEKHGVVGLNRHMSCLARIGQILLVSARDHGGRSTAGRASNLEPRPGRSSRCISTAPSFPSTAASWLHRSSRGQVRCPSVALHVFRFTPGPPDALLFDVPDPTSYTSGTCRRRAVLRPRDCPFQISKQRSSLAHQSQRKPSAVRHHARRQRLCAQVRAFLLLCRLPVHYVYRS